MFVDSNPPEISPASAEETRGAWRSYWRWHDVGYALGTITTWHSGTYLPGFHPRAKA